MAEPASPQIHAALASPLRAAIYRQIAESTSDGLTVAQLSAALELHPNTLRFHLRVLADADLIQGTAQLRQSPGRPLLRYQAVASSNAEPDTDSAMIEALAEVVGRVCAATPEQKQLSTDESFKVGNEWAERRWREASTPASLTATLDEMGFSPTRSGQAIKLRSCPFRAAGKRHPDVVCAIHAGFIGRFAQLAGEDSAPRLLPFVQPDLCVIEMQRAEL